MSTATYYHDNSDRVEARLTPPPSRPPHQLKVFAYITRASRLLVMLHPDAPEAGMQVPAGTVEPGEDLVAAVVREAREETGLTDLSVVAYLGERLRSMTDFGRAEIHHRHFYHLRCDDEPPEIWHHAEPDPSFGDRQLIPLSFHWVDLARDRPNLIADHDALLDELIKALNLGCKPPSPDSSPKSSTD